MDVTPPWWRWTIVLGFVLAEKHARLGRWLAARTTSEVDAVPPWWRWTIGLAVAIADPVIPTVSERVDRVRSAVPELVEIAKVVARQVEHPQMLVTEQHRPTDLVHNKVIQLLSQAGFLQKEIGCLVFGGDDPAGAADRVRKRLQKLRTSSETHRR